VKTGKATNSRVEGRLERSNGASETKGTTSLRDVTRRVWKKRSFPFKRKGQRGDMPSSGTQRLSGSDDAASQGGKIMTWKRRKPNAV
jgi:hypothetical protein